MKNFFFSFLVISTTVLGSCSKDEDVSITILSKNPIVLNYEETMQIEATSAQPLTYLSENEYHAKVSTDGVVTANYVGETEIMLDNGSDKKIISVEVEPRYNLYETPCLEWGISKSEIIKKYGNPDQETSSGIGYTNHSSTAPMLVFLFDDSQKLIVSSVLVKVTQSSTLVDFLLERYLPIDVDPEKYTATFMDALTVSEAKTTINVSIYNLSYLTVLYMNAKASKTKANDMDLLNVYKEVADLMLK